MLSIEAVASAEFLQIGSRNFVINLFGTDRNANVATALAR